MKEMEGPLLEWGRNVWGVGMSVKQSLVPATRVTCDY